MTKAAILLSILLITLASFVFAASVSASADDLDAVMSRLFEARDLPGMQEHLQSQSPEALQSASGYRWQAWLALSRQELDEAEQLVGRGLGIAPENIELILLRAGLRLRELSDAGAMSAMRVARAVRQDLERAVELAPDHVDARISLAQYYLNAPRIAGGGRAKADEQLAALRERAPADYHGLRGQQAMAAGDPDAALAAYAKARAIGARGDILLAEVLTLQQLERWDEARERLLELLAAQPQHAAAWYQLGRTAVMSGSMLEEGREAFERFLALPEWPGDPSHAAAWWRIGMLHELAADNAQAAGAYRQSLALDPGFEEASKALARLSGPG
jgi:tetratricopeptide (TPR) repeat protein